MDGRRGGDREANRWHTGPDEARDRDSGSSSSPAAILLFALIGATATTAAVGQLRRTVRWFYTQLSRSEPYVYWEDVPRGPNRCGDAWRYYRRTRETSEDQRERVERIMRMQDVLKKERSKCRDYRTRDGNNPTYHQHSRREEWYGDAETFYANQRTNFRSRPREAVSYTMSHHYSILGLNRSRSEPFSDAEIKVMCCWYEFHMVYAKQLDYLQKNKVCADLACLLQARPLQYVPIRDDARSGAYKFHMSCSLGFVIDNWEFCARGSGS